MDISNELFAVKSEIASLKDAKTVHVEGKRKQEIRLGDATARIRLAGRLPQRDYNQLVTTQTDARKKIKHHESEILKLNSELRRWYAHEDELRAKIYIAPKASTQTDDSKLNASIVALRDKYIAFSEDATRVNSMRLMAGSFAGELTTILRQAKPTT